MWNLEVIENDSFQRSCISKKTEVGETGAGSNSFC